MAKRNGYFRLKIEENGIFIQLVPPAEDGEPIRVSELMEYLTRLNLSGYDIPLLNKTLLGLKSPSVFKLSDGFLPPVNAMAKVQIASDRMSASVRLYPPSNRGKAFDKKGLLEELNQAGIKFGISERIIDAIVATPLYCRDLQVAKGRAAVQGTDAKIQYFFETKPLSKPKLNEDGTVDFHQLNIFTKVEQGQLLAELTPETLGESGSDVLGNPIVPHKVKKAMLKFGKGIRLSEDRLQMFSEVDGDVKLEHDTVYVSNSYTVSADVDTSTGDIIYDGNVIVNGNVRTGFNIHAKGDIQVKGVVEGADLFAGGNIVLSRGIQGMNRGRLEAKGDIITKFIESATVKAGGNIRSGSILHSQVESGDTIICEGRKSFVIGGSLSAVNLIDVKAMGNQMGTITNVKLGVDLSVYEKLQIMKREYDENISEIEKCNQILMLFKKRLESGQSIPETRIPVIRNAGNDKIRLSERQEELMLLIEETKQLIEADTRGKLRVSDTIYPGVRILIANTAYIVRDKMKYSQFALVDGEIVVTSY